MVRTGRPRKEPTDRVRIKRMTYVRVCDLAALAGMSIPDYLESLVPKDASGITKGMENETKIINKLGRVNDNV